MIDIAAIKQMPKEERTDEQIALLFRYNQNCMLDRRRNRRRIIFTSLGVKKSNYANSTLALWPMLDDEDPKEVFINPLVQTFNQNYHDILLQKFETIDDLHDWYLTQINEKIPCSFMVKAETLKKLHVWCEIMLWSKFNAQLLTPHDNNSKHAKVDYDLFEEILGQVQRFYKDPQNK